jgi:hypothetical protein
MKDYRLDQRVDPQHHPAAIKRMTEPKRRSYRDVGGELPRAEDRRTALSGRQAGAFARRADARALFPQRFAGSAGLKPISFIISDMARLRSLSVQSTLVSKSELPAALRISTTYRAAFGLRGGMGPDYSYDCWAHVAARALLVIYPVLFAVGYLWAPEAKLLSLPISRRPVRMPAGSPNLDSCLPVQRSRQPRTFEHRLHRRKSEINLWASSVPGHTLAAVPVPTQKLQKAKKT